MMPFFTLVLLLKKMFCGLSEQHPTADDELCTTEILNMEEGIFNDNDCLLRWPVVQCYRNLLIVVLNIFILNPILKSLLLIPVLIIFITHDFLRLPYKHNYLNLLQVLSSASLLVINGCNIPASFSVAFDLTTVPVMENALPALIYIELVMVSIVPLSLIGWMLWEKILKMTDSE